MFRILSHYSLPTEGLVGESGSARSQAPSERQLDFTARLGFPFLEVVSVAAARS